MIILDTNVLVNIFRKKKRGEQWKGYLKDKSVAFTSITAFELFLGAELSKKRDYNMKAIQDLAQQLPILPFSVKSAYIAAGIYSELQNKCQIIELNDIYIAAIAMEQDAKLATDNIEHFKRIVQLEIVNIP